MCLYYSSTQKGQTGEGLPALKVIGSGASDFFLGMERSFCWGWLDMNPGLPLMWVLGRGVF